jgi:hypothetical protein
MGMLKNLYEAVGGKLKFWLGALGVVAIFIALGIVSAQAYLAYEHLQLDHQNLHQIIQLLNNGQIHIDPPKSATGAAPSASPPTGPGNPIIPPVPPAAAEESKK